MATPCPLGNSLTRQASQPAPLPGSVLYDWFSEPGGELWLCEGKAHGVFAPECVLAIFSLQPRAALQPTLLSAPGHSPSDGNP